MILIFFQFLLAAACSYFFLLIILPQLSSRLIDIPNQRSSHSKPIPRGGGIAFVIIGTIFNYYFNTGAFRLIPILCLPIAIIGIIDDIKDLSAILRYSTHVIVAYLLIIFSNIDISYWQLPIYILVITAIINLFNFMDGLDGLLAGCSIPLFASTSAWSLSGAIFGFTFWNWSPAKIFMGDVGSTFLGAVFAGFALQQSTNREALFLLFLAFPLFADSVSCIVRRLLLRQNIFKAHRNHLYQRLNQSGWSHQQVSSLYISGIVILAFVRRFDNLSLFLLFMVLEFLVGIYLELRVASKFQRT
jgi:Fuc2NAc and GlcNAc transferase